MTELRMISDEEQIRAIDEAVAMGGVIMSVRKDSDRTNLLQCDVTFVSGHTGEEVEWTCGRAAGLHAQRIMDRT